MKSNPLKIFFSGIAGSGMSAIAVFMSDKGHKVSGSDRLFDVNPEHPMLKLFAGKGIKIVPQDGRGIDKTFAVIVFSTAVEQDNIEYTKAKSLGLFIMTRPEYLANIIGGYKTTAVSGTSGKSTTSGLLAFLMHELGMNPNFIGGGRVKSFRTGVNPGNSLSGNSELMVIEACESDGTIVNYYPENSIILNLALDHHSIDKTSGMFKILNEHTSGMTIINRDDENIKKTHFKNAVSFSIDNTGDYKAENISQNHFSSAFTVGGVRFRLSVPGRHNIYNALSAIALLSQMRVPLKDIAPLTHKFSGIERRFDIHVNNEEYFVVDDYAHNPHKIAALMQTAGRIKDNICYIFQPHGFAPLRLMQDEYISTFISNLRNSDHLILLPVFYAGGTVRKDISSSDLAAAIIAGGKSAEAVVDRETVLGRLSNWKNYIIFGARDDSLSAFATKVAERINVLKQNER
jgi:UDP-N-acetylmuramate--alanine ligase